MRALPPTMAAQYRIACDRAISMGLDASSIRGVILRPDGTIANRTHHPIIFDREFLEYAVGTNIVENPYGPGGHCTIAMRVYMGMCLLDWLHPEDRDGKEPLSFLCSVVLNLPDPIKETNPYKHRKPLAAHITRKE